MSETIYCGSGKKMKGNWRKVALCLSKISKDHIFEYEGREYVKLNVNDKDEKDQYGKDVSVTIDTWKPSDNDDKSDLPF